MLNIVKGFRRLVLTAGLLCGVGLFLCPVEAKAALSLNTTDTKNDGNGNIDIVIENDDTVNTVTINEIVVKYGSGKSKTISGLSITIPKKETANGSNKYTIDRATLVTEGTSGYTDGIVSNKINFTEVSASGITNDGSATPPSISLAPVTISVDSNTIYTITAKHPEGSTPGVPADGTKIPATGTAGAPVYTVSINGRTYTGLDTAGTTAYGYADEKYTITSNAGANYYENCYTTSMPVSINAGWRIAGTATIESELAGDITKNFAYIPKINSDLKGAVVLGTSPKGSLVATSSTYMRYVGVDEASYNEDFKIDSTKGFPSGLASGATEYLDLYTWEYSMVRPGGSNIIALGTTTPGSGAVTATIGGTSGSRTNKVLFDGSAPGYGELVIKAMLNTSNIDGVDNVVAIGTVTVPLNIYINPSDATFKNVPVSVPKDGTVTTSDLINSILPAGADPALTKYTIEDVRESGTSLLTFGGTATRVNTDKKTLTIKAGSTAGTAKVQLKIRYTDPSYPTPGYVEFWTASTFDVNITSVNATKTKEEINKGTYNFITSGYEFDVASMIRDLAVYDGTAPATRLTPDTIDFDDSSSTNYAEWVDSAHTKLKGKAAGTVKIKCNLGGVALTGIEVKVYPVPVVKYNSDRTVSVDVPGKASVGYRSDSAVKSGTGFKLILTDGSGNALYSENTKFQNVISSPKDYYTTYTVSKSDIESMVTNAASNGKFNAETTSVKFKAIPMGKKYSDDSTITTDERIYGTADTTVYRVTANANSQQFDVSYAYGLDGQTVNLTANPKSGYTFKSWQDNGSTSNPRQITISGSGTRSFSAVAGDRVNPNGPGGTGADGGNSSLYDDVPKTAEGNGAIFLIIFMVFAVMGTVYALYIQLKAATNKNNDK